MANAGAESQVRSKGKVRKKRDNDDSTLHIVKEKKIFWITKIMAEGGNNRELFLKVTFEETIMFIIYLSLITIIAMSTNPQSRYQLKDMLKDQFVDKRFKAGSYHLNFNEIRNHADFWAYLEVPFFDSFYWDYWYDDVTLPETSVEDENILYENVVIGVPRFRQVRVTNNSCPIHKFFNGMINTCYAEYSENTMSKESFGLQTGTAWNWNKAKQTGCASYWGQQNTYDGSGYYEDLTLEKSETLAIFKNLKNNLWVTRETRAVFLDFTIYNANLNLFNTVKLVFEFPPTGGITPTSEFHSMKFIRYLWLWDFFVLGCECVFYLFMFIYTAEAIRTAVYLKWRCVKCFWFLMDVLILMLSYSYFFLAIFRYLESKRKLTSLAGYHNQFSSLEKLTALQIHFNDLEAVVLFFVYMKMFKYITFNKTMSQLNNTLRNCALDIIGFSIMFSFIFIAYAVLGFLIFGSQVDNFQTFGLSTLALLRTILGDFDYTSIERTHRVLAPIFFISFIFFVFFILLNMFLAIITDTYGAVKTELSIAPDEMQMSEYVQKSFYEFLRRWGCSRWVKPIKEKKVLFNVTLEEIRGALRKTGFSDLEVEMFFARYNIDMHSPEASYDIDQILEELKRHDTTASTTRKPIDYTDYRDDGVPIVPVDKYLDQLQQVYDIETKLETMTQRVDLLLQKLDNMENVRRTPIY